MTDASITTFPQARAAVTAGMPAAAAAKALVASLTPHERLWCLDGDAPTWAGLKFLGEGGYHRSVFIGGEIERVGLGGIRFSDGPRGAVVGNATAFPVSMARGATWDLDLEERIGDAIGSELRAIGANLTGAVCINLPANHRSAEARAQGRLHSVGRAGLGAEILRSEERRVGKECRSRWSPYH